MRAAGCDHGIENRFSMCALIWLPRPRREPALRERLQVVADVRERHRVAGERDRDPASPSSSRSVCSAADQQRQERVVARLGGLRAVVADVLELAGGTAPASARSVPIGRRRSSCRERTGGLRRAPPVPERAHCRGLVDILGGEPPMAMAMMRFNWVLPGIDPETMSGMYRAALDMASYGEENGFVACTLEEHHGAVNGWSPTPLLMAGMILSPHPEHERDDRGAARAAARPVAHRRGHRGPRPRQRRPPQRRRRAGIHPPRVRRATARTGASEAA